MKVETKQIISVTTLQRELTKKIRELSETGETLYILKKNSMEAVMLPFAHFEYLQQIEEMIEQLEIKEMVDARLGTYDRSKNIPWDSVLQEQ